jgi:hypothetical protein
MFYVVGTWDFIYFVEVIFENWEVFTVIERRKGAVLITNKISQVSNKHHTCDSWHSSFSLLSSSLV